MSSYCISVFLTPHFYLKRVAVLVFSFYRRGNSSSKELHNSSGGTQLPNVLLLQWLIYMSRRVKQVLKKELASKVPCHFFTLLYMLKSEGTLLVWLFPSTMWFCRLKLGLLGLKQAILFSETSHGPYGPNLNTSIAPQNHLLYTFNFSFLYYPVY